MLHGTLLSAFGMLLLHVSPLRSVNLSLFSKSDYNSDTYNANSIMQKSVVSSLTICFVSLLVSQIRTRYLCESESKIRSPEEGAIRLAGSKTRSQGRVEVYLHGEWGTVCHNAWDLPDAQVVCRQLHFKGAVSAAAGGTFGEGGPFSFDIIPPLRGNGAEAVVAVIEQLHLALKINNFSFSRNRTDLA